VCGIFGFSNIKDNGESLLRTMANQQIHRGPDSEGFFTDGTMGFGLRRLSVIDLATGNQPIRNEDKSIWVVCNGEIYNYRELSESLKEKGHKFYTKSDVECIVHLYEEYGIECLKHLNGMFGLALYDARKKRLYIARDRLGIKPLYYSSLPAGFLFSSELRSLLSTSLVSKDLDWNSLSHFLDALYIPTPGSPFRDISKLKPGHYLEIDGNNPVTETPYWSLEDPPSVLMPATEEEAIEQLTALLKDSNRMQIRADVPICAFLSGGIDSSAVVAFAAQASSVPLKTYHVYFENASQKIDERHYARSVASMYGTIHSEVMVNCSDFRRLMPKLIWHLEEPFGDLASVPTYIISERARKEVTVCLNGSGGDELFAGYSHHSHASWIKNGLMNMTGIDGILRSFLGKENNPRQWSKLFPSYGKKSLRTAIEDKGVFFPGDRINRILARDIDGYLQSNVLFLLDKVAMAVSLEGRVPLLDHRFVEVAAHLPSSWKLKNGERKYIFKKMLEPYLPHAVLYRKKEGFGAPLNDWLDKDTVSLLRRIAKNGLLKKNNLIRFDDVPLVCLKGWDLWKVACLELWYRVIVDSSKCPEGVSLEDFA
jgi:asparagine synthase (glutamine-hydrolysing)